MVEKMNQQISFEPQMSTTGAVQGLKINIRGFAIFIFWGKCVFFGSLLKSQGNGYGTKWGHPNTIMSQLGLKGAAKQR